MVWRRASIGFVTLVIGFSGPADADRDGRVPRSVADYAVALDQTLHSKRDEPIEALYGLGTQVAESLLVVRANGGASLLESLDEATFTEVQGRMRGFTLGRDEVVVAVPDPQFFLELARSRGDAADTAFFHALSLTYAQGMSPVYVAQQTDYSGCTDFGSGTLVATFAAWSEFMRNHPGRYEARSRDELHKIEEELASGTCACGDKQSLMSELRAFLRRFPSAAVAPRVRARLRAVDVGASGIRYHCISG